MLLQLQWSVGTQVGQLYRTIQNEVGNILHSNNIINDKEGGEVICGVEWMDEWI